MSERRYLCERCGGTGRQEAGCWDGKAYASPAGQCEICKGEGYLGLINQSWQNDLIKQEKLNPKMPLAEDDL